MIAGYEAAGFGHSGLGLVHPARPRAGLAGGVIGGEGVQMPTALASDLGVWPGPSRCERRRIDGGAVVNAQIKPTKNPGAFAPGW